MGPNGRKNTSAIALWIPLARSIPTNLRRLSADGEEKDDPKPSLLCPNSTTKLVLQTLSFVENTPW
jgi:hypothetical protein